MIRRLTRLFAATLFLLLSALFFFVAWQIPDCLGPPKAQTVLAHELNQIPDYDYLAEIRALKIEGRLAEALDLARFVASNPDWPGAREARRLAVELEAQLHSLRARAMRTAEGFVLGEGDSIEEVAGAIASDFLVWGDIRDLIKQGYYTITGQETDPLIAGLAAFGLATSITLSFDVVPAVLKAYRKVGALSKRFCEWLMRVMRGSISSGRLSDEIPRTFASVHLLTDRLGLARSAEVMKTVDDSTDLHRAARLAGKSPDAVYLTARFSGDGSLGILQTLDEIPDGDRILSGALRKGARGIRYLEGKGRPLLGMAAKAGVLAGTAGTKSWRHGRLQPIKEWVREQGLENPDLLLTLKLLMGALTLVGVLFAAIGFGQAYRAIVPKPRPAG